MSEREMRGNRLTNVLASAVMLVIAVWSILPGIPASGAVLYSTTLELSKTSTADIGEAEVSIPLVGTYRFVLKLKNVVDASLPVRCEVDKDTISPGETVMMTVSPSQGDARASLSVVVYVYRDSELQTTFETQPMTVEFPNPGSYSGTIPFPVIPLEIVAGVPMEISVVLDILIHVYPSISFTMVGVTPQSSQLVFHEIAPETIDIRKERGLGAVITMDTWSTSLEVTVTPSLGLSVAGRPTPLRVSFPSKTIPVAQLSQSISYFQVATLKTPVRLEFEVSKSQAHVEEEVEVSCRADPPEAGIDVKLLVAREIGAWETVGTGSTDSNGRVSLSWVPDKRGEYLVTVVHEGSALTLPAESTLVTVKVVPFNTTLQLDAPSSLDLGEAATFTATLVDEEGTPLQGMTVDFYAGDVKIGSILTDSGGVASVTYTPEREGDLQVKAVFGGTEKYAASQATAVVRVQMNYLEYYTYRVPVIPLAVAALIIIIAWIALRRRRY